VTATIAGDPRRFGPIGVVVVGGTNGGQLGLRRECRLLTDAAGHVSFTACNRSASLGTDTITVSSLIGNTSTVIVGSGGSIRRRL
jgi:hypothetical protein